VRTQTLRDTMDKLKDKLKTAMSMLAGVVEQATTRSIAVGVTHDFGVGKVKTGELVNFITAQVGA
jgi:alanyl-tRNA synthetase